MATKILSEYIDHLHRLDANAKPNWGSMNAQQMVEHLALLLRVSNGKIKSPQLTPPDKLERMRGFLFSEQPMPQNFKAPFIDDAQPLRTASIAAAISELQTELKDFDSHYSERGRTEIHPVFGALDHDGWKQFHSKHFTHHLTQFGLIGNH